MEPDKTTSPEEQERADKPTGGEEDQSGEQATSEEQEEQVRQRGEEQIQQGQEQTRHAQNAPTPGTPEYGSYQPPVDNPNAARQAPGENDEDDGKETRVRRDSDEFTSRR